MENILEKLLELWDAAEIAKSAHSDLKSLTKGLKLLENEDDNESDEK